VPPARRRSLVPPAVQVPAPPRTPLELDPLMTTWAAGRTFHRCFDIMWGSRDFHAGDDAHRGRFHPFNAARARSPLPVLYGASDVDGALSETVFHNVPLHGSKHVTLAQLLHRVVVALAPTRDLQLVDLTSDGLRRLELTRPQLIDSDERAYPATAAWAKALHDHPRNVDGLMWVSRQRDTSLALVLFGDRVKKSELTVAPGQIPLPLGSGPGLDAVATAANRAGITISGITASSLS
jgi:hypothetical protein